MLIRRDRLAPRVYAVPFLSFLPLVVRTNAPFRNKIGAELTYFPQKSSLVSANVSRRHWKIDVRWDLFEPQPGQYTLPAETVRLLSLIGESEFYISFKVVPEAYRLWPEFIGSPPAPDYWDDLGRAIVELIRLTGADYVELFNEPNFRTSDVPGPTQVYYGAMVGTNETYYDAGFRYGKILEKVNRIVEGRYGEKRLFAGALAVPDFSDNSLAYPFLKGIFDANNGNIPAAAITIHPYVHNHWSYANWDAVFVFAKNVRSSTKLPVIFSETALLLADNSLEDDAFRVKQAKWLEKLRSERFIFTWYSFEGQWSWYHNALIRGPQRWDPNLEPTVAYYEWAR
jgi:hypothetical protein